MANRAVKKSGKHTPLREVGARKPAKKSAPRNARRIKAPRPKVDAPPADRDPSGTRHGKKPDRKELP